ncbi:MAG: hypothetical protein IJ274_10460 [Lachnospiraceae bacterium]|nr:hypothetical protein [Lachnospiraceae bacterium]
MLRRLNNVLPELILGIIVYGVLAEVIGIWFVTDKLAYTIGLVAGVLMACGMAINMASVILDTMDGYVGEAGARVRVAGKAALRYCIVAVLFMVMAKFEIGNFYASFIGVLGLKISAYLQPFTHKVILKLQGRGDESSDNEKKETI